jgi:hypothetical protein
LRIARFVDPKFIIPSNFVVTMESKESVEVTEKVYATPDVTAIDDSGRKAERRLRTKIDFFVVPTVTLLYLMCFIDRTNIGMSFVIASGG